MIAALKDNDRSVWWSAAEALGNIKDARAVDPLIAALKDDDIGVRREAAGALEKIGGPSLIESLKDSKEQLIR